MPTNDWMACDGEGSLRSLTPLPPSLPVAPLLLRKGEPKSISTSSGGSTAELQAPPSLEGGTTGREGGRGVRGIGRRAALTRLVGGAALAAWAGSRSALAQVALGGSNSPTQAGRDVLVYLFLRGGADGLSIVVPWGDGDYYAARPTLGLRKPLDLDGFFGLHPAMSALLPLYREGQMAAVQAVGSQDRTRSHFEAMATVERGLRDNRATAASGWLGRYLSATTPSTPSPLRAVAWGDLLPDSLRGALDASAISSLDEFRIDLPPESRDAFAHSLTAMYAPDSKETSDAVKVAGQETLSVLQSMQKLDPTHYRPENGAKYPANSGLGDGLRQIACLLKADVGLEVACLDRGGWDTHVGQGGETGWLALQLGDVADSLAAFARDLGAARLQRVTVVVMTEFGRRVAENSGLGTDHGRASAMLLLGGGVVGGRVHGRWPGLAPGKLEGPGDLTVTTDYRTILAEIIARRLNGSATLDATFPDAGFGLASPPSFLQVVRPA